MTPAVAKVRKPDTEEQDLAKLRSDGDAALAKQEFSVARRAFTEYYKRALLPDGLYRLGLLADAEGRVLDAQDLMRRFVSDPRFDAPTFENEAKEAQRILALPRPPNGKVTVIGERGVLLMIDGRLVGGLPLSRPLLLAPGKRMLAIEDGSRRQREELDVAVGHFIEITYDRGSAALLSAELPSVLVLEQYRGLPKDADKPLGQAIEDALQGERLSPFPVSLALAQAGLPEKSACVENTACQLNLAQKSELDYVLSVDFAQSLRNGPWALRLVLLDVEVGAQAARIEQECSSCDIAKSVFALSNALPPLITEARRRPRGDLEVKSTPPGAEVRLAGRLLGKTPLAHPVWAGEAEIELTLSGYQPLRQPVDIRAGQKTPLDLELAKELPESLPPPLVLPPAVVKIPPPRRPTWRLALGGVALATGALLIGFGGGALAIDGRCIDSPENPIAFCDKVYQTSGLGAGLVGAGSVLVVSGVVLLALPPKKPAPKS